METCPLLGLLFHLSHMSWLFEQPNVAEHELLVYAIVSKKDYV